MNDSANLLMGLACVAWLLGILLAALISRGQSRAARLSVAAGCALGMGACINGLLVAPPTVWAGISLANLPISFRFNSASLWLMGFGLLPAGIAVLLGSPAKNNSAQRRWLAGVAIALLGSVAVFGCQDAMTLLIGWELMSLGGALMILGEEISENTGRPVLFMLALLEAGAVALLLAVLLLGRDGGNLNFSCFATGWKQMPAPESIGVGLLLIIGFGAKLGLMPFYEWFAGAYGNASGASGAVMSGVVLNAAFFALGRALLHWLAGNSSAAFTIGVVLVATGVLSAILSVLFAFQQEDWRILLGFSTAENAGIACTVLGAALIFRQEGLIQLAMLAWVVCLLHLAGHSLAKGSLMLCADGLFKSTGTYEIKQSGLLRRSPWMLGVGAVFAGMSLAAMPPQAGFVSEWYVFQTMFQGFHLPTLGGRMALALAGAGLALTAAVALATFVKVLGIGLLGDGVPSDRGFSCRYAGAVFALGLAVLLLAVGMPWWLGGLGNLPWLAHGRNAVDSMRSGLLLVPLTSRFAFISPTLLVIVMPFLAILPLALVYVGVRRGICRRPVWYGGRREEAVASSTTALAFSNALRTFYSFIYRPVQTTSRETGGRDYFIHRLKFDHHVAPLFGPHLFRPIVRLVQRLAHRVRRMQSGYLNAYLAFIGALLVVILFLTLF